MFRKHHRHLRTPPTSHVDELPKTLHKHPQNSWAETFYRDVFCRLGEAPFAVLYADCPSRPNVPVNVLVGLEFLKAANGWTDEEMYGAFCYDVRVCYALGYRQLGEGYFDLRTLYYFRERLGRYMQETGVDLLKRVFEQVTDAQLAAFQLKSNKQRTDSTLLASNIRKMGRIQLLVEVLQRFYRLLSEAERERYGELFAPYLKGLVGQYVYRLRREEMDAHLQRIGEGVRRLLSELREQDASEAAHQVLERVFKEHFRVQEGQPCVKSTEELSASILQSPDDLEAAYRKKRKQECRGYVANLSETCYPQNPFQLITNVQVASSNTDDGELLLETLPQLKARNGLEMLYTDGVYAGPQTDAVLQTQQVEHIQTAFRGCALDLQKLHLEDFFIQSDEEGKPLQITCPGQSMAVVLSRRKKSFLAHFDPNLCRDCPLVERCPVRADKGDKQPRLRFTPQNLQRAPRRRRYREHRQDGCNLQAAIAIESTVRSVKHPFPGSKMPVRGRFRATCPVIGSTTVANLRRVHRYLQAKMVEEERQKKAARQERSAQEERNLSFLSFFETILTLFFGYLRSQQMTIGW